MIRLFRQPRTARRASTRRLATILVALSGLAVLTAPAAEAAGSPACTALDLPVHLGQLPATVHAQLCRPRAGVPDRHVIEVMVPGATYNHFYFDGVGLPAYSQAAATTAAGYTTLAIDRVGTGASSPVPSDVVTATGEADVVHQIIGQLRDGAATGHLWRRVVLVGHSLGSMIATIEAGTYHDVDAVELTGVTAQISTTTLQNALGDMHQASLEGLTQDPGYLTTVPGTRGALFHAAGDVDPAVVAADEAHKDIASASEMPDAIALGTGSQFSRAIDVPVLEALGGRDGFFCAPAASVDCSSSGALRDQEASRFAAAAHIQAFVLPCAGHDLSLARNAAVFFTVANLWADTLFPVGSTS